jgi:hypothetical protein
MHLPCSKRLMDVCERRWHTTLRLLLPGPWKPDRMKNTTCCNRILGCEKEVHPATQQTLVQIFTAQRLFTVLSSHAIPFWNATLVKIFTKVVLARPCRNTTDANQPRHQHTDLRKWWVCNSAIEFWVSNICTFIDFQLVRRPRIRAVIGVYPSSNPSTAIPLPMVVQRVVSLSFIISYWWDWYWQEASVCKWYMSNFKHHKYD